MQKINVNAECPCHSGKKNKKCCRVYHQGRHVTDVVALMRARYSAYALSNADFIIDTTHSESPYVKERAQWWAEITVFCQNTRFDDLHILDHDEDHVTFKATLTQREQDASFIEKSTFAREEEQWKYLQGDNLNETTE